MARVALILRYQWRAHWRRFMRTGHRVQFYLVMVPGLFWWFFVRLPATRSRAAHEMAAGQTDSMDVVLAMLCVLWLLLVVEDASISITSRDLLAFPIDVRSLLGVRILSLFCSPVALLVAVGSLISLWPLVHARHAVLGGLAALLLLTFVLGLGLSVAHLLGVAGLRRKLLVPAALVSIAVGAFFFAQGPPSIEWLRTGMPFSPPHLVSAAAVAVAPSAAVVRLLTLLALTAPTCYLVLWSFRRSLSSHTATRSEGRAVGSVLWFPGRFGGLLRKEQYYFRRLPDLWIGLVLVLAISVGSLFGSPPPVLRQSIILVVFALNLNAAMNCFGMDTGRELTRYSILPLRGQDVLLVKNLGLTVLVAAQLSLLILSAAWRSGPVEAGTEMIVAAVLLFSYLALGNLVSVTEPFRMHFYRFASGGSPLTGVAVMTIGSVPGVAVLLLRHSGSSLSAAGITMILLLVIAIYCVSLHYAGKSFEQRRHIIAERLSL